LSFVISGGAVAAFRRLQVVLSGRVQGVGFRFFAVREAQTRELTGWVRNVGEDKVEVVAEGPEGELEALLAALRQGPPLAWISAATVEWREPTGEFRGFEARASGW
jgi:acylphosphatase